MRVVQVSAHYPPNFTSGGVLVPQRLARGLLARGHEVAVYAGYLDESREPLSTWEETDEAGVRVRWVVTTPWTGWGDRRSFDNPPVAQDFAGWLAQVRAEVVHLHSLQTLGGDLVRVAKESGALVVVTMHDFWWSCARQFLVDTSGTPCSLVVDCGRCSCQVTHAWGKERRAWLAERIALADMVLAPSGTAADVLAANGVDRRRLRVEENGVPRLAPAVDRVAAPDGSVRLLYAGGEDPMKGFGVLRRAVGQIQAERPWTLDLYNVSHDLHDPRVRSHPAFAPDELPAVLARHDVLVLPSVMRESHSILTREALTAGLPVVCTDSLGPEEVVVDGVNGLVVPSADPAALARALSALVDSPGTVQTMAQAAAQVTVRTVESQVEATEALYRELRHRTSQTVEEEDGVQSVLFVVGITGAPLRYRAHLAAEALATCGVSSQVLHYRDPAVREAATTAGAVVFYRVPATVQMLDLVEDVRGRQPTVPVLYDVDDLIVDPTLRGSLRGLDGMSDEEQDLWWHGVERYRTMLEAADGYVGSTNGLCEAVDRLTGMPTYRFANGVGAALGQISEQALAQARAPGPLRVGYFSGTTTHDADWALVAPVVADLLRRRDVELWLGGPVTLGPDFDGLDRAVHRLPLMDWTRLPARLRQLDVNLAPLVPGSVFNESKSAIKWLEAALVATPTVASPTEPFREAVDDGVTGLLATTTDEWATAVEHLLDDAVLRARMGGRARRAALLRWAPAAQGHVYQDILRDAAHHRRTQPVRTSSWVPVADDEPYDAAAAWVDPYPPARSGGEVPAWRRRASAVRRVYRDQGARGVVAAVTRRWR
ncbi:MAG: glycosyltransferase [Micrococcales bacterium]|nr:glycosyltransferase [Micrococcales bacterium]